MAMLGGQGDVADCETRRKSIHGGSALAVLASDGLAVGNITLAFAATSPLYT